MQLVVALVMWLSADDFVEGEIGEGLVEDVGEGGADQIVNERTYDHETGLPSRVDHTVQHVL